MSRSCRKGLRGSNGTPSSLSAPQPVVRKLRCAVYTRKSSEEGLEQEFNSLDALRAAGAAYIASQRAEGWSPVDNHYDDGGHSGATLDPLPSDASLLILRPGASTWSSSTRSTGSAAP